VSATREMESMMESLSGKRRHEDEKEDIGSDIHHTKGRDCSHNTNDVDVEDDEDEEPRPAKRLKLPSAPTYKSLTPLDRNSKARPRQPRSNTPPLATQLKVIVTQPKPIRGFHQHS
jgi:hypothetical protein